MGQLTVYIDDTTRKGIETAARSAGVSVSRWVKEHLTRALSNSWPEGYFEVLGSLEEADLERPEQPAGSDDLARESL